MSNSILSTLYSGLNYAINLFYKSGKKERLKKLLQEIKTFTIKQVKAKVISRIAPQRFHKEYKTKRWYLTEENYAMFLTGLYYLGYEKYADREKGQEKGTDQFLEFYDKLVFFIGNYYKYTQSKKLHHEDNEMQIAQVQFIKFLDQGKSCVIKNTKSYIHVLNYTKPEAKVTTNPKNFKQAFFKCAKKIENGSNLKNGILKNPNTNLGFSNPNIISSMLLFNEEEEEGHANTLIISYKTGSVWRVEPNVYYYWTPFFYDNLDRALYTYFNKNKEIGLEYKGLYPYTLKSTPDHVGLCVMISVLQLYLPQNMTHFNVKYYLLKFFEWEYYSIFHKKFDIHNNCNQRLIGLSQFIHKKYKMNYFEINKKQFVYKQLRHLDFDDINQIVIKKDKSDKLNKAVVLDKENATKYLKDVPKKSELTAFSYIK